MKNVQPAIVELQTCLLIIFFFFSVFGPLLSGFLLSALSVKHALTKNEKVATSENQEILVCQIRLARRTCAHARVCRRRIRRSPGARRRCLPNTGLFASVRVPAHNCICRRRNHHSPGARHCCSPNAGLFASVRVLSRKYTCRRLHRCRLFVARSSLPADHRFVCNCSRALT